MHYLSHLFFIFTVLVINESFPPVSGCVRVRSFSRPHTWSMQSNAWRSLCGASSGLLIRGSSNTSALPPRSAEWSSWPERRSRTERCNKTYAFRGGGAIWQYVFKLEVIQLFSATLNAERCTLKSGLLFLTLFIEDLLTLPVQCVVIGLQSTGEARTLEALEEGGGELNDFVSTAKYG